MEKVIHFTRDELLRSDAATALRINNDLPQALEKNLSLTMTGLERIRAYLNAPMRILSGYRCPILNTAVGGAQYSQHMQAQAADFISVSFGTPQQIFAALIPVMAKLGIDQLILEKTWVHVSFTLSPRNEALISTGTGYVNATP